LHADAQHLGGVEGAVGVDDDEDDEEVLQNVEAQQARLAHHILFIGIKY